MNAPTRFRLLLQVRIAKRWRADQIALTTTFAGQDVTIRSTQKDQPIAETKWIIFETRGFPTEREARDFGERLQTTVQLAALCSHLGASVGHDETLDSLDEDFFLSKGLPPPPLWLTPETHGVLVLQEDDEPLFPSVQVALTVVADPAQFLGALDELDGQPLITEPAVTLSVWILNLALINSGRLAKIVLAFSAIEALAQDEDWSCDQRNLIERLAREVENRTGEDGEQSEVADAIRRLSRMGLRQGVKRLLCRNDLSHLQTEWTMLHDRRSNLFHGREQLTKPEIKKLAADTVKLCCRVILGIIRHNGIKLPSIARSHFGNI